MKTRSRPLINLPVTTATLCLLMSACGSQSGSKRGGPRPMVAIAADPSCKSSDERNGTKANRGPDLMPDDQFCGDVAAAIKQALDRAGFQVADGNEAPLILKVSASQKARIEKDDSPGGKHNLVHVSVLVVVTAKGEESEKLVKEGDCTGSFKDFLSDTSRDLVSELAASPRLKDAGLTPG